MSKEIYCTLRNFDQTHDLTPSYSNTKPDPTYRCATSIKITECNKPYLLPEFVLHTTARLVLYYFTSVLMICMYECNMQYFWLFVTCQQIFAIKNALLRDLFI